MDYFEKAIVCDDILREMELRTLSVLKGKSSELNKLMGSILKNTKVNSAQKIRESLVDFKKNL